MSGIRSLNYPEFRAFLTRTFPLHTLRTVWYSLPIVLNIIQATAQITGGKAGKDIYNQFLLVCRENGDSVSMKLFETVIDEEQIHYNYFDNINGHIDKLGPAYLANIAGTPSSTGLTPSGFVVSGGE